MDLLRFDVKGFGPYYVRPEHVVSIGKLDDAMTNVGVVLPHGGAHDLPIEGDADDIASEIERAIPGARIYRIN